MVDGSGLENRHTRKGIGGSNPSLSASTFVTGQARDAPKGMLGARNPGFVILLEHPYLLLQTFWTIQFWWLSKLLKLAAPQYVASFGVRLDLHVIAPCPGIFADSFRRLAFGSWTVSGTRQI